MTFNKTIEERYKEYQERIRNGIATINDIRQIEGLEPIKDGNCKYITFICD
jgi:hypothetical protein